jgi:hypothetical protein
MDNYKDLLVDTVINIVDDGIEENNDDFFAEEFRYDATLADDIYEEDKTENIEPPKKVPRKNWLVVKNFMEEEVFDKWLKQQDIVFSFLFFYLSKYFKQKFKRKQGRKNSQLCV